MPIVLFLWKGLKARNHEKIFLIGMGGHAKVVKDIIELNNEFEVIGYLDDKFHEKSVSDGIIYDNLNSYRNYRTIILLLQLAIIK